MGVVGSKDDIDLIWEQMCSQGEYNGELRVREWGSFFLRVGTQPVGSRMDYALFIDGVNLLTASLQVDKKLATVLLPISVSFKHLTNPSCKSQRRQRLTQILSTGDYIILSRTNIEFEKIVESRFRALIHSLKRHHFDSTEPTGWSRVKAYVAFVYITDIRPYFATEFLALVAQAVRFLKAGLPVFSHPNRKNADYTAKNWTPIQQGDLQSVATQRHNERQRTNILFALHWLELGGAEKFAVDLIRKIDKNKYRVFVTADTPAAGTWEGYIKDDVAGIVYLYDYVTREDAPSFINFLLVYWRIDIVHIHHSEWLYMSLNYLRRWHGDSIKILDSLHIIEKSAVAGYPELVGMYYSEYIDAHHVVSDHMRRFLIQKYGVRGDKIHRGYLIQESLLAAPRGGPEAGLRANFNFTEADFLVAFVGRLVRQKRPELFIRLARRLLDADDLKSRLKFLIVGDGILRERCERLAKRLNLGEDLFFTGEVQRCSNLFAEFDLVINPAENEGLALVTYEAMSCGTPVICTDVGAQYEALGSDRLVENDPRTVLDELERKSLHIIERGRVKDHSLTRKLKEMHALGDAEDTCFGLYRGWSEKKF